jgi:hypothetical protein
MDEVNQRDESFGYANRMDEKYDFVRTVRKGKYHYMRCFEPWLPDGLNNNYRYKMLAYEEWRQLWKAGRLSGPPAAFFEPKPVEMLFDCEADPHNVTNLADDPEHAAMLEDLRSRLGQWMRGMPDLSLLPESQMLAETMDNPTAFGQSHRAELSQLADTADLALQSFEQAKSALETALESDQPLVRCWAAMVCSAFGDQAEALEGAVRPLLEDETEIVQVRAIEFLGRIGAVDPQPLLTQIVKTTEDPVLATEALNATVWFRDHFGDQHPVERTDFTPVAKGADVDDRLNYINGVPYPPKAKKNKKGKK